jgi:hypothetical protein
VPLLLVNCREMITAGRGSEAANDLITLTSFRPGEMRTTKRSRIIFDNMAIYDDVEIHC